MLKNANDYTSQKVYMKRLYTSLCLRTHARTHTHTHAYTIKEQENNNKRKDYITEVRNRYLQMPT